MVNVIDDMLLHITCCVAGWAALWQLYLLLNFPTSLLQRLNNPWAIIAAVYIAIAGISDFLIYPIAEVKHALISIANTIEKAGKQ